MDTENIKDNEIVIEDLNSYLHNISENKESPYTSNDNNIKKYNIRRYKNGTQKKKRKMGYSHEN